jgi:valyl-tRNA synthetase
MTENCKVRNGYIIRILQHFATKLWNITNFVMLFQAVMKFLSRLVEFKILVNWGLVHWALSPVSSACRFVTNLLNSNY